MTATGYASRLAVAALLLCGAVMIAVGLLLFNPAPASIWCDWGYAPTRYVPVADRPYQCTSFRSNADANSGPDGNDTSWTGYGLGPSPTPLAVGENWDSPVVPPGPDRRGLVLVAAGLGSVGLSVGIGRRRRRAETDPVTRQ